MSDYTNTCDCTHGKFSFHDNVYMPLGCILTDRPRPFTKEQENYDTLLNER